MDSRNDLAEHSRRKIGLLEIILIINSSVTYGFELSDLEQLSQAKATDYIAVRHLHVPAGDTLDLNKLKAGTTLEFSGTITFGYREWKGPLVRISGANITVKGLPGNLFDCQGIRWWDSRGTNGGKQKPKFIFLNLSDSTVDGLHVKNTPAHAFSIRGSNNLNITGITIDNADGKDNGGHNTDGFDINSNNVRISNCTVTNQDDCMAMNSGSDVVFENNLCIGGHGISIGSVGGRENNVVQRVHVKHCKVIGSTNGVRIKTIKSTSGLVENVTFEDIELQGILECGIKIHGNYKNVGGGGEATPGVPIVGLTVDNVYGTVLPNATNVYINVVNASDWTWKDNVMGGSKNWGCKGIPSGTNVICGPKDLDF